MTVTCRCDSCETPHERLIREIRELTARIGGEVTPT